MLSAGGLAARTAPSTPQPAPTTEAVALAERSVDGDRAATLVRPEGDVVAAGAVSGAPEELAIRPVRIYQPAPVRLALSRVDRRC